MGSQLPAILIVDDDPDALFLTKRLLARAGIENRLVTAQSGEQAIDYLRNARSPGRADDMPALLFLDINMPLADGFKVLHWIRKDEQLRTIKVVILTSSDAAKDQQRASEYGADAYLVKYPSAAVVGGLVRSLIKSSEAEVKSRSPGEQNRVSPS
jgi:two-component system, response regulator